MTPLMAFEILLAEFLFAYKFPRKNYFWLRFLGSGFCTIYITVWIEILYGIFTGTNFNYEATGSLPVILFKIAYYIVIFAMTIFCFWFSFQEPMTIVFVTCSLGYAMQFFASNLGSLLLLLGDDFESRWKETYTILVLILTRALVYFVITFFMIRKHPRWDESDKTSFSKIALFSLVILMCIGLSRLANDDVNRSLWAKIVEPICFMLVSTLIIAFQFSLAENENINKELASTQALLHQEREQYALSKESIEIINEKCHDLKHQIAALRENSSEKNIAEIEKAVMIYDSSLKTGNDALDILIAEKKLQCDAKGIKFTSVVNGEILSFLDDMDLYSLFGNAISNAIESVSALSDPEKKHIALKVRKVGSMVSIHIENYYEGNIVFEDGLPKTKKDENFHGFGMKSMKRIVDSYHGTLSVTAQDHLFQLDILFPQKTSLCQKEPNIKPK